MVLPLAVEADIYSKAISKTVLYRGDTISIFQSYLLYKYILQDSLEPRSAGALLKRWIKMSDPQTIVSQWKKVVNNQPRHNSMEWKIKSIPLPLLSPDLNLQTKSFWSFRLLVFLIVTSIFLNNIFILCINYNSLGYAAVTNWQIPMD